MYRAGIGLVEVAITGDLVSSFSSCVGLWILLPLQNGKVQREGSISASREDCFSERFVRWFGCGGDKTRHSLYHHDARRVGNMFSPAGLSTKGLELNVPLADRCD